MAKSSKSTSTHKRSSAGTGAGAVADVGVRISILDPGAVRADFQRTLADLANDSRAAGKVIDDHAKRTTESIRRTTKAAHDGAKKHVADFVETSRKAHAIIEQQSKRLAEVRTRYAAQNAKQEKQQTELLVTEIKRRQDLNAKYYNALRAARDKDTRDHLAKIRESNMAEMRLLKQVANEKAGVTRGGMGARVGMLGIGREIIGQSSGVGGMLMGSGGAVTAGVAGGLMLVKSLAASAKAADDAVDQLGIAMTRTGLQGAALDRELERTATSAARMSDKLAMSKNEIMASSIGSPSSRSARRTPSICRRSRSRR
jgi:hypothetical protein